VGGDFGGDDWRALCQPVFTIDGGAYKVIAQVERSGRLTADDLQRIYVTGPNGQLMPLGAVAETPQGNRAAHPQSPFSSSMPSRSRACRRARWRTGCACWKTRRRRFFPLAMRIDYTGESRQLRQESGQVPARPWAWPSCSFSWSSPHNSILPRSLCHPGRSAPLAMFGALIFTFLKFQGPPGMTFPLTAGWTCDTEHLLPGRIGDPGRPGVKERHPDRRIRQRATKSAACPRLTP